MTDGDVPQSSAAPEGSGQRPRRRATIALTATAAGAVLGLAAWGLSRGNVPDAPTKASRPEAGKAMSPESGPAPAAEPADPRARNAALHVAKPEHVRGLYLNAWNAGSPRKLAKLIDIADRTEINTFVIDVKEGGFISYRSQVAVARDIGSDSAWIRDPRGLLARLKEHGIYPIARIVCFKDARLAEKKPEWAIRKADGSLWRADDGKLWVDAYNRKVWDYNIAIAQEALDLGFAEVQWDYVRFPDVLPNLRATQVFPDANGRTRQQAIREFMEYSKKQLTPYGVPVTADVFGSTVKADDDMGIGQKWEQLVDVADVLLPMVYPSHFYRGDFEMQNPNAHPFRTVYLAMQRGLARSQVPHAAAIRPWLQDFTMGRPRYGAHEIREQIRAGDEETRRVLHEDIRAEPSGLPHFIRENRFVAN